MNWSKFQLGKALKITIPLALIIIGGLIFFEFADGLVENELHEFDHSIISVIAQAESENMTKIGIFITNMGDAVTLTVLTILLCVYLLVNKRYALAVFVASANLLGGAINWILKASFERERPSLRVFIEQGGFSFPSGHAMGSMIMYGSLAVIIVMLVDRLAVSISFSIIIAVIIMLIGVSRVYLGVHFPSDIFAGFAAGAAWLTMCFSCYLFYQTRKN
ncbi:phosphatase PAP2 family protein [Jeotgalibacillus sp. S-D1]|uniref:phosphatase PAP2 family protein n=1 Tax=Jeotgalibacillus sp. S-D1 TaxID=2552189 RepID=UPI001404D2F6|nr:phosphatase PAP2 family protein [Jeotgalibacillus sp. S-D1]